MAIVKHWYPFWHLDIQHYIVCPQCNAFFDEDKYVNLDISARQNERNYKGTPSLNF